MPSFYRVFGLSVRSEIALPDLAPGEGSTTAPDVVIAAGAIQLPPQPEPVGLSIVPGGAILNIPEAGRYLVTGGNRIIVDAAANASERSVRLYLLGSAFAAILHQRGLLPLHANTIDFGGAAIAFMGHSGAGKSTLAGWFHDHGLSILGDDVCVVTGIDEGTPVAVPGLLRIRLWGDALSASGRKAEGFERSFDDMDKYDVPLGFETTRKPLPLAAIYLLQVASIDQRSSVQRLRGAQAIEALVANTYRGGYLPLMGRVGPHLAQCVSLSRHVSIFSLRRRWSLDDFATEAALVQDHVSSILAEKLAAGA